MKNTFVKVLSFLMALTMIVGMFSAITVSAADECTHTKGEVVKTVEPTCEENGYTRYTCAECGEEYIPADTVVLASPEYHDYEETEAKDATCLADATTAGKKCKLCDQAAPDGGIKTTEGSQLEHTFKRVKVAATCDDNARWEYVCSSCDLTAEEIDKLAKEKDENNEYKTKWVKGQSYEKFKEEVLNEKDEDKAQNPGHKDLTWEVVTSPKNDDATHTCTDGLLKGTCEKCGFVEERTIPVEHKYTINLNPNNATCLPYKSGFQCSVCYAIMPGAVVNENPTSCEENEDVRRYHYELKLEYKDSKDPDELKKWPTRVNGEQLTLAELEALGFGIGDKLYKDNSCTQEGFVLTICPCGQIYIAKKAVDAAAHAEKLVKGEIEWPTLCTEAAVRVDRCANYAACGYEKTVVIQEAAATAHKIKTNVVDPKCEEGGSRGYTENYCENTFEANGVVKACAHGKVVDSNGELVLTDGKATPIKTNYKDALQHVWGTPYYKSGECGSATYEKQCSVCEEKTTAAEPAGTQHIWNEAVVEATCKDAEYVRKTCLICDKVDDSAKVENPDPEDLDPTNHVYDVANAKTNNVGVVKAATCTEKGEVTIVCTNPKCTGTAKNVEIAKLSHNYPEGSQGSKLVVTEFVKCTEEGCTDASHCHVEGHPTEKHNHYSVVTEKTPATCQAVGYKNDGKWCLTCGTQAKAPTVIDVDENNHVEIINNEVDVIEATCQSNKIVQMSTACCGIVYVEIANTKVDHHEYEEFEYNAPTCTKAGNHAYKACKWCKEYLVGSMTVDGCELNCSNHAAITVHSTKNYAIAALGHKWKEVAAVAETCTQPGTKKFFSCERCEKTEDDGSKTPVIVTFDKTTIYDLTKATENAAFVEAKIVYAHNAVHNTKFTENKTETCTEYGIIAYKDAANKTNWCTKCDVHVATNCPCGDVDHNGLEVGDGLWLVKKADHTPDPQVANEGGSADCTKPSATVTWCKVCKEIISAHFDPAKKTEHKFNDTDWKDKPFAANESVCTTDAKEIRKCEFCAVTEERKKEGGEAIGHYTTKGAEESNAPKFFFDLSCDKIAEFMGMSCDVCHKVVGEDLKVDHANVVKTDKEETCLEDGYHIEFCTGCNETLVNNVINEINKDGKPDFTHADRKDTDTIIEYKPATTTENGYIIYVCSKCEANATEVLSVDTNITVSGELSAEEVVAGTTVEYTISFAGAEYEFNAIKLNVAYNKALFDFVSVSTTLENGATAFASVNADDLGITVVVPATADDEEQTVTTSVAGTAVVTVVFQAKKYAIGNDVEFNVVKLNDKTCTCEVAKADVRTLGNLNSDAWVTAEDATAVSKKFGTDDVYADINGDGIVDIEDFARLATFAASNQTAKDYLIMVGTYGEIKATIDALYDTGRIADVNRDHYRDINDFYTLTLEVDTRLAAMDKVSDFIKYASVEEFVTKVMTDLALIP